MTIEQNSNVVRKWEDVPPFVSEAEELAFWDTHTLAAELFTRRGPRPGSLAEKLSRQRFRPHASYSREDDAAYVYLSWGQRAESKDLGASRRVDFAPDGAVTGIQFHNASKGLDLSDLPERDRVWMLVKDLDLPVSV